MQQTTFEWTLERTTTLTAFWKEGIPTAEIGRRLGVSKNAVIGKAHRLGLPKRQPPTRGKAVKKPLANVVVRLETLGPGMCSWPKGDPGAEGFRFCGEKAIIGKPYCENHCAKAYIKPSKDRSRSGASSRRGAVA